MQNARIDRLGRAGLSKAARQTSFYLDFSRNEKSVPVYFSLIALKSACGATFILLNSAAKLETSVLQKTQISFFEDIVLPHWKQLKSMVEKYVFLR